MGRGCGLALIIAVWVGALAVGFGAMFSYSVQPGASAEVPVSLERTLPGTDAARLHLFLHPYCPCTRATVEEFERVLLRSGLEGEGVAAAYVCWDETEDVALESDLVARLSRMSGVRIVRAGASDFALRLGVRTSGHLIVTDGDGVVVYSGGLTDSRGHAGASDSREAALRAVRGELDTRLEMPVFGCPLFSDEACGAVCGVDE